MAKTDALDIVGLCLLALFGFAIWPPLCLAVFGAGALLASHNFAQRKASE